MEMTPPVLPVTYLPHPLAIDARQMLPSIFAPGRTLREHLLAAGIDPHREIVVYHNACLVEVERWDVIEPVPGDFIVVEAVVSGGDDSNPIASILSIALMVFAPYAASALIGINEAAVLGSTLTGIVQMGIQAAVVIGGNLLISKIFSPHQASSSTRSIKQESPTYSLSGGSNRLRPYEPLPLLMGNHRIFPDYASKPYTEFEGDDQYLYQVFNFGIGNLVLEDLRIGETLLSSYSDVTVTRAENGVLPGFWGNVDTTDGATLLYSAGWIKRTTGQATTRIAVDLVGTFYYASDDGGLDARGADFGLEFCVSGTNNWQPFVPTGMVPVTYYWSYGRWQEKIIDPYYDEEGNYHAGETMRTTWLQQSYDTNLSPGAHVDGGDAGGLIWRWVPVGTDPYPGNNYSSSTGLVSLSGASTKPQRRTVSREVTSGQYDVRVRRLSADETDSRASSTVEWTAMRSYQEGVADYSNQTVIGVKIKATAQLNGVIEQLSALGTNFTWVWDGSSWIWAATTNPAWWYLNMARGFRDASGRLLYGGGLSDDRIDIEGIKAWAVFCDANALSFSCVFDTSQTLADALSTIARCGFATYSWASGKLGVVWDAPNQAPVMAFGMSNIIKGSFEVSYITSSLADEIVVNFTNRNRNWESDQVRVTVPGTTGTPVRPSTVDLQGCTTNAHAGKFANALAAQQVYRRRSIVWEADYEGTVCQRGDVVILSHDLTQWGYSGRLVGVSGNTITLSRAVPRNGATEYLMVEYPDGTLVTSSVAAGTDDTDTLTLAVPVTLQEGYAPVDHKWFFSPLPTPGKKVKITAAKPLSTSRIRLTATDEYPEYYAAWNGTFTSPPRQTILNQNNVSISHLALTLNAIVVESYQINRVTVSWRQHGAVESCTVTAWLDGTLYGTWAGIRDAAHIIDLSEQAGELIVEVTPIGASGPGAAVRDLISLSTLPAPAAPVLTVTGGLFSVEATWTFGDARQDVRSTEIWFASTNNRNGAVRLTAQPFPATKFAQVGLQPGSGGYYWSRVIDTRGNPSAWYPISATGGLHATASTDPDLLLEQLQGALGVDQLGQDLLDRIDSSVQTPAYSESVTYKLGDIVSYAGGLYMATQETTGHPPTNAGYWSKIGDYASLGEAVAAIQEFSEATADEVEGVQARWGVTTVATGDGGRAVGGVELLSGASGQSTFAVLADKFLVYKPDGTGTPKQALSIGTVNGVSALGFDGSAIFDGSVITRHLGAKTVTADKINGTDLEVVNGRFSGQINVGAFTGFAWPPAGQGGVHLSVNGLLLGNNNGGGKYFQINSGAWDGNAAIYTNIPAYLEDAQVTTLKIAGNAVTVPVSGNASVGSGGSGGVTLPSTDFGGGNVCLVAAITQGSGSSSNTSSFTLYRDGSPLIGLTAQIGAADTKVFVDAPGGGAHSYSLSGTAGRATTVGLLALGVKR